MEIKKPKSVDEYIGSFSKNDQKPLNEIRKLIKECAPKAEEVISYGIPAYRLHGMLIWFGGHKNHIGLYPKGSAIKFFEKDLLNYNTSKGTIQFPFNEPVPRELVKKIIKYRVKQNLEKAGL